MIPGFGCAPFGIRDEGMDAYSAAADTGDDAVVLKLRRSISTSRSMTILRSLRERRYERTAIFTNSTARAFAFDVYLGRPLGLDTAIANFEI